MEGKPKFLAKLQKMNLLASTTYIVPGKRGSKKLSFGIDTILNRKCSSQQKREKIDKEDRMELAAEHFRPMYLLRSQKEKLEEAFQIEKYIGSDRIDELAEILDVWPADVRAWFRDRRLWEKRKHLYNEKHRKISSKCL